MWYKYAHINVHCMAMQFGHRQLSNIYNNTIDITIYFHGSYQVTKSDTCTCTCTVPLVKSFHFWIWWCLFFSVSLKIFLGLGEAIIGEI